MALLASFGYTVSGKSGETLCYASGRVVSDSEEEDSEEEEDEDKDTNGKEEVCEAGGGDEPPDLGPGLTAATLYGISEEERGDDDGDGCPFLRAHVILEGALTRAVPARTAHSAPLCML